MPGIAADALAAWLGRGEIDVPLRPLDADVGAAAHVRLVWSTGEPAAGLVVQGLYPTIMSVAMALRSDERGVVAWERAPSYFGLLVYEGGAPVHYVVMARRAELRDERIPRSLEVAIEIPDFEPFEGRLRLTWELEPRFLDGLDVLDPTSDDGYTLNGVRRAPGRLITDTHTPPLLEGRLVEHQPPRFSCRLPAGVRTRLFAGQGRHLDVEPARAGERIVAPWDSLARSR